MDSRTPPEYVSHLDPSTLNGSKLKVSHSGIWEHTLAQFSAVSLGFSAKLLCPMSSVSIPGIEMIESTVIVVFSVLAHSLTF